MRAGLRLILCALALSAALPAAASAVRPAPGDPPDLPSLTATQFALQASNGYEVRFNGSSGKGRDQASLSATKAGATASYSVRPERLTKRRIVADFGPFGVVRVKFKPKQRPDNGGRCLVAAKTKGVFKGRIRFRGEGGFTRARAVRARGSVTRFDFKGSGCGTVVPVKRPARARVMTRRPVVLSSCSEDGSSLYQAFKVRDRKGERVRVFHEGYAGERRGRVQILRSAFTKGPAATFTTTKDLSAGRVRPGGPFAGSAGFSDGRLAGDLTMAVPGVDEPVELTPGDATLGKSFRGPGACHGIFDPARAASVDRRRQRFLVR